MKITKPQLGKVLHVRMSEELLAKLNAMAVDRECSVADVVRDILKERVRKQAGGIA